VTDVTIRPAQVADAAAIAAIYNQGIEERQATFETRPRAVQEIAGLLAESGSPPFLVAQLDCEVAGWGRLSAYSPRSCYAGVGEASVYLERAARGQGLGRRLIEALCDAAERDGYWKIVGLLFPTNAGSVALCRAAGFREVGVYRRHGQLDGEWRDVVIVERLLAS
jgi:L-amino acid N-acyltransferase YncA